MTAAERVARVLSGAYRSGMWWRSRCPVHGSRGSTLALLDGARGLVVHCHAGCDRREILAELHRRGLLSSRSGNVSPVRPDPGEVQRRHPMELTDRRRRIALAQEIWLLSYPAAGSPVQTYLTSRGLTTAPPPALRWAPRCRHPSGICLPAMVARIDNLDGELIGLHRTFLRPDGSGKANVELQKAMLGRASGGAVRLAPAAETLMIGEGIETCLAAMQATAQPTWAALSAIGIERLLLPLSVRTVIVLADHDRSGTGERAARTASQRWGAEGRRVRIAMPPEPGTDMADVLAGRGHVRIAEVRDAAA
jgi:putative DNA primase/helicase